MRRPAGSLPTKVMVRMSRSCSSAGGFGDAGDGGVGRDALDHQRLRGDADRECRAERSISRIAVAEARPPTRPRSDAPADTASSCVPRPAARAPCAASPERVRATAGRPGTRGDYLRYTARQMRAVDIILSKRDGRALSRDEIRFFVDGVTGGTLPDYQASALLMAILLRGMTAEETAWLTDAMVHSGVRVDLARDPRRQGRQAQHRRRRRQDVADPGAAGRRLRRAGADDVRPRPRAHRRHARQARGDSRLSRQPLARGDEGGAARESAAR